ncbi:hypothetical protein NWO28_06700 [Enterococcus faecalis]|nr:hypothetical protein [Enterococcus faecalis]
MQSTRCRKILVMHPKIKKLITAIK